MRKKTAHTLKTNSQLQISRNFKFWCCIFYSGTVQNVINQASNTAVTRKNDPSPACKVCTAIPWVSCWITEKISINTPFKEISSPISQWLIKPCKKALSVFIITTAMWQISNWKWILSTTILYCLETQWEDSDELFDISHMGRGLGRCCQKHRSLPCSQ